MKKILLALAGLICILAACTPKTEQASANVTPPNPTNGDYAPNPGEANLKRESAHLDSSQLITLESHPLQFALSLKGYLPTPCNKLRIAVEPPDVDRKINVEVYSVVDPTVICMQITQPFAVNFPLGSYPAGHYSLWVNGQRIAEFEA